MSARAAMRAAAAARRPSAWRAATSRHGIVLAGVVTAALTLGCGTAAPVEPADIVIVGARVWTGEPDTPWAEAVAVRAARIVRVGDRASVEAHVGPETEVIHADGGLVTPGFIDSHVHFLGGGFQLDSVQLRDANSRDELARRLAEFASTREPGTWIMGGNWDHELWGGELPHRDWIDAATPDHPVFVSRLDGHMALANSAALRAAGIDGSVADVAGGEIVRDAAGRLTGVFKDNAQQLVADAAPPPDPQAADRALQAAMAHVATHGVTTVHHMGTWDDLAVLRRAAESGTMSTRVRACLPLRDWQRLAAEIATSGGGDEWLAIGCLKAFVDGSLGSHTAAFLEPYTDAPGDAGLLVIDPAELARLAAAADAAGLQLDVHAIGDRAIRMLLDVYARVARDNGDRDRRLRIEHAQHINADDLGRFVEQGVIASMQPYHAIDDGRWAERLIGTARAAGTYAFRDLLDSGAALAFGSDWTVAPASPLLGIYAAVTRRTIDGAHPEGWIPAQRIGVEEALRAYTATAAYAGFQDGDRGTLRAGKLADLAVIDRDITTVPPDTLADARVLFTLVGGRIVHRVDAPAGASR